MSCTIGQMEGAAIERVVTLKCYRLQGATIKGGKIDSSG